MPNDMDRRRFLRGAAGSSLLLGAAATALGEGELDAPAPQKPAYQEGVSRWPLALNTSTIRPASLQDKIRIAAEVGYDAIELWMDDLERHEREGGDLKELARQIGDKGLALPNVIGLWDSLPAGQEQWEAKLPETRERMRRAADVGSRFVAAIPTPDRADFDLKEGAGRYRELLKAGREDYGITVAFEFVGFFKGIHRLGQAASIALDANDPDACLIADTFHLYRGGSGFDGLRHLQGSFIANFHWNDAPGDPPREQLRDRHRLYPGDGVLPLKKLLADLKAIGYEGALSLELFRREHWDQDPSVVAETGLRKMRELIASAEV
jgi:2-keto-myo-inositol isomerase